MNHYRDWMMAFYQDRIMNGKNAGPLPDAHSLVARRKLVLALDQGVGQRRRNYQISRPKAFFNHKETSK